MKRFHFLTLLVVLLLLMGYSLPNSGAQGNTQRPLETTRRTVKASAIVSYLKHPKRGDRIVIPDVPLNGKTEHFDDYEMLDVTDEMETAVAASKPLVDGVGAHVRDGGTTIVRVEATVVTVEDLGDLSQLPYATKVTHLNADGSVDWMVDGPQPAKLIFRQ